MRITTITAANEDSKYILLLFRFILLRKHFLTFRHRYYTGFDNSVKAAVYSQFGIYLPARGLLAFAITKFTDKGGERFD